jgi:hypothetical protein
MIHPFPSARSAARAVGVLLALVCVPAAHAQESYYVLIFGSQSVPKRPRHTHSWATFVRAPAGETAAIEDLTLSWLPATLNVRPLALRAERGVNLGLHETIGAMSADGQRIRMWGPYQIDGALYERARAHKAQLDSGFLSYKALDSRRSSSAVSNCMHAVCDALGIPRNSIPESQVQGEAASSAIASILRSSGRTLDRSARHDWIVARLGLTSYAIGRGP